MGESRLPAPGTVYRILGARSPWSRLGAGVMDKAGVAQDHQDYRAATWSLIYVLRGRGRYRDAQGRTYPLGPGDCFVRQPQVPHTTQLDPASGWLEAFIDCGPDLAQALIPMQVLPADPPVWHWGLSLPRIERFTALRDELQRAADPQLPELLLRLLGLALACRPAPRPAPAGDVIERACALLAQQAPLRQDLRAWCRGEGLVYEQFRKHFRATVGVSPGQYRIRRRMELACALLQGTARTVAAIASELGYRSPYEFSAQFRAHLGVPPSRYRART